MTFRSPLTSLNVTGTVTVAGGSTGPTSRVRSSTVMASLAGSSTVTVPPSTLPGDLLVGLMTSPTTGGLPAPSSGGVWNRIDIVSGITTAFWRPATAADAGAKLTFPVNNGQTGSGWLFVLGGVSALTLVSSATLTGSAGSLSSGVVGSGAFFLGCMAGGTTVTGASWAWGNLAQGGPPSPPPWASVSFAQASGLSQVVGVSFANWLPADSYAAAPVPASTASTTAYLLLAS